MTDIHSHLIYGIDDGSRSVEESIALLTLLNNIGFNNIIITPHYIENSNYSSNNKIKLEKLNILKQELKNKNLNINIYLGNEIFINNNIDSLIKENNIYPLNNTRYILVELPLNNKILNIEDRLYELTIKNYIPIIAHPERYTYFQKDYKLVDKLKNEGILFQSNYLSILGNYGKEAKKLIKYMLKKKYVDFLATDIHRLDDTSIIDNFPKIEKKIISITKEEYYNTIKENSNKVLNNEDIYDE